jgi:Rod binding domain-containing protein
MTDPIGGGPRPPNDLLEGLRSGRITGQERKEAVARLVDSTFLEELFRALRSTVEEGGAMGAGESAAGFLGMMDQHLAEAASHRMRLGFGARMMGSDPAPGVGRSEE